MYPITPDTTADLFFQLTWQSANARHADAFSARRVNFYRDLLPPETYPALMHKSAGDEIAISYAPGQFVSAAASTDPHRLSGRQFDPRRIALEHLVPRQGRFYPKGVLTDMAGIFSANREPFRCVGVNNGHLMADFNHPLSGNAAKLKITVGAVQSKLMERGGTVHDWGEVITQGVGMQARWRGQPTDFFSDRPFDRRDTAPDGQFYATPRFVQHLDDTALEMVRAIHGRFLRDGMQVLDLMSSWRTHLPGRLKPGRLSGLGLNVDELKRNADLDDWQVKDLNADPALPYDDAAFDAVLCAVSVEYLIHPQRIFEETARVLKPGGVFVVSFSNRWFPPKAVRIWTELHEFERMGLVLEYFLGSGRFKDLGTYSIRGLDRPRNDKYWGEIPLSDPVYAVWGVRA